MKTYINPFNYPIVIKQVHDFITVSVPDLEITVADSAPSGSTPGNKDYVTILNALILKAARRILDRTQQMDTLKGDSKRTAKPPSFIKNSISRDYDSKDVLTTKEAARFLGVSQATLKRWEDKDYIRSTKTLGGHRRFTVGALTEFKSGSHNSSPGPSAVSTASMEKMRTMISKSKTQKKPI